MRTFTIVALFNIFAALNLAFAAESDIESAKSALFDVLADYEPGSPITEEIRSALDSAVTRLEQAAGEPPDLRANINTVTGQWVTLFSSQGIVGEIDLSFMTRTLPGGGKEGGTAQSLNVTQEIRPEDHFYRNMMVMAVGEDEIPMLYVATAGLDISSEASNVLEVRFKRIAFVPGRADVSLEQLRESLLLPPNAPLTINVPVDLSRPASTSTVVYLDDDIRINRGKDYFAILRKVR